MVNSVNNDNKEFFILRDERCNDPDWIGLNEAQRVIITKLATGYSLSRIAREFNVHYETLKKETKSLAFIEKLNNVNSLKENLTMEEVREALSRIVRESSNENAVINAAKVLISMAHTVTSDQLYDCIVSEEVNKAKAHELLVKMGIIDEEEE